MYPSALYAVGVYMGLCLAVLGMSKFTLWRLRKMREKLLRDRAAFLRKWKDGWDGTEEVTRD